MIRVLIADDHPVVRAGLWQILAEEPSISIVGEVADGDAVVAKVANTEVDVVLLDITMPGAPFPSLLKRLKVIRPKLQVLVLSMHPEGQFAVRALRDGAAGYLTKERSPEELVLAIKKVHRGGKYVTATLAEKLACALELGSAALPHEALSDREFQVLCLLGAGKTVTQTAAELSLSPKTVSTHRTRILHKMNLRTNADLIRYALQHGLTK